ncbi:hypothetical protein GCM10012287_46370 [Streptomyces daqingensis]|uniref:Uncharacterized protein n=1 Tax=Streptomyces daqingensis TaxID=1472640 RepID=A0ABQ2MNZ7_9ACTN|nr:hypothetical protein [Streptomyces daqingensis]GGO55327.1 hypothetical protein GCM10012287_46370 [Streptomyces daqingensis]
MIRIVTSRRLAEMESERNRLREQADTAEAQAQQALDREVATQVRLAGERVQLEKQLSGADFAREVAESANTKLRAEVEELVEEVRQAEARPKCVYVLTRFGEIHSLHTSQEAAKAAAARNGADPEGWSTVPKERPLAPSPWGIAHACVRPEQTGGTP